MVVSSRTAAMRVLVWAKWERDFCEGATWSHRFYLGSGTETMVKMMHMSSERFAYGVLTDVEARVCTVYAVFAMPMREFLWDLYMLVAAWPSG